MRHGGRQRESEATDRSLRLVMGLTAALLVAAGTQVIPSLPIRPVPVAAIAGAVTGIPFEAEVTENRDRILDALAEAAPTQAELLRGILAEGRKILHLDLDQNRGRGSWAELVGTIDEHTEAVGVLVAGGNAHVDSDNFDKYRQRALDLVAESDGSLAVVVWAAGRFPRGWIQAGFSRFNDPLAEALARFSHEVRAEIERVRGPGAPVRLLVAGHSYGGAVVGTAERYGLDADAVLHIGSIGVGKVRDPYDYPEPERPRYSMTAPGDLIGYVQGLPLPPGLGHGPDPDSFRCVTSLPTGRFPDDPAAPDEQGRPLGDRAGTEIAGVPSHSDVFVRHSDAWWEIYRVFVGDVPEPPECPPLEEPEQLKARVLPLVVPRAVTASLCRTTGLRPARQPRRRRGAG